MRRVLFADNNQDFANIRAAFLERAGFQVIKAYSAISAIEILQKRWVHVAILDMRLENDDDPDDTSGLKLAKDIAFRHIPKIILTAYPTYEYVREVMGPSTKGLPPAIDFISKEEPVQAMINAVERAFSVYLGINWDLKIHWSDQPPYNFANLATLFSSGGASYSLDDANELEDLFRRVFVKSEHIIVDRVLWRSNGRVALGIIAHLDGGMNRNVMVTCGRKEAILLEQINFNKAGFMAPVNGNAYLVNHAETLSWGANCYELGNIELETIHSLARMFEQSPPREISTTLERLMQTGLNWWHQRSQLASAEEYCNSILKDGTRSDESVKLDDLLKTKLDRIGQDSATAGIVQIEVGPEYMTFRLPKGGGNTYPNPIVWMNKYLFSGLASLTQCGFIFGQIKAETILIDNQGQPWITDFGSVTRGPLLSDYGALETTIKFDLLDENMSLQDISELESILLSTSSLTDRLESLTQQANRVIASVQRIRQQAAADCGVDIVLYFHILMVLAARRVLTYAPGILRTRRELLPFVHACMSLGMLCARLEQVRQTANPSAIEKTGIEIDVDNREVRVHGKVIGLAPTEYNTLLFLWQRPGRLCLRKEIVENIYGRPYEPGKFASDDANLNMLISRIREKIETNPKHPQYLIGKRGAGYILYPLGTPAQSM